MPGSPTPSTAPSSPAPAAAAAAAPSPPQDAVWYVGISGEPVGPVGHAYLREQIDAGKVKPGSLVWREGLTDWKPLNTFDELRALLSREAPPAQVSVPVALTRKVDDTPPPSVAPAAALSTQRMSDEARADVASSSSAEPKVAAGGKADTVEPAARAVEPPPSSKEPAAPAASAPVAVAVSPAPLADLTPAGVPPARKSVHPMAWAFVAMAAAFGAVSAWFLFGQPPPAPTAMNTGTAVAAPEPDGASPRGVDAAPTPSTDAGDADAEAPADGTKPVRTDTGQNGAPPPSRTSDGAPASDGTPDEKPAPKPCNPDDPFCSPGNVDGPSAKPTSGDQGESGQGLSPAEASATVSRYRGSLMRRCRPMVTTGSAKVAATITVGPSGAVQSAAVSGGKEFPGLASCVRATIMSWRFPTAGGTSTISVSFNFL